MKLLGKRFPKRLLSLLLVLCLLLSSAQALTPEQASVLLTSYYIDYIPESVLLKDSVEDMLAALGDPYTRYLTPEEYGAFMNTMEDDVIYGIGVTFTDGTDGLPVLDVLPDSSAHRAGIVPGDVILSVNGQSIIGQPATTVAELLRGEVNTLVTLEVRHADGSVASYTLTRGELVIPATQGQLVDGHIGYISCGTFGPETLTHFREVMDELAPQTDTWIVDLRSNLGGDVSVASNSLGFFLGQGGMAYLRNRAGEYAFSLSSQSRSTLFPAIVLTSPWTASSAELFAAAMRDAQGGIVIGSRTFGKGIAQAVLDQTTHPEYFADGSAMTVTAFRIFSPAGTTDDIIGVIPHLLVPYEMAPAVALLLSSAPQSNRAGSQLRLHLGSWRWFLDLEQASQPDNAPALAALLEALPPQAQLFLALGNDQWLETTPREIADQWGLSLVSRTFADTHDSPYETAISTLAAYQMVRGGGDSLFHPQQVMTRAELCALLSQCLNLSPAAGENMAFADVSADAWYAPAVNAMARMGFVNGIGDGLFHPQDIVTREQMFTVMSRLAVFLSAGFYGAQQQGPDEEALAAPAFAAYSDWAKEAVWLLGASQTNLLGGPMDLLFARADQLNPTAGATREEAAAQLYSILSFMGLLPA